MPNETDPFSDRIHIERLEISTHIGVPEKERAAPPAAHGQYHALAVARRSAT
jgi:hypothetical protein